MGKQGYTDAELGLEGYVMFRKDRMERKGGGVLLYVKDTISVYEVYPIDLLYINDLESQVPLYKYVDDSTLFEICNTNDVSVMQ